MKQYPPVSFVLALVFGPLTAGVLVACVDHAHPHIAFASTDLADDPAPSSPASTIANRDARVVLVTIDGVRAEDVFDGADPTLRPGAKVSHLTKPEAVMPRTHELVATRGVALGANLPGCGVVRTATGANVSMPGYLEIFTGRQTRCRDNRCARTKVRTVLDEIADAGVAPVASIGSWELLDRAVSNGSSAVLVAEGAQRWPGPRPLVEGQLEALVSAGEHAASFPGGGKYRPDEHTSAIALEYLRTTSPRVLHVGLGDADEWGHKNDYRAYLDAVARADTFIGQVADTLDAMGDAGANTTVIVTTDHGRNRDFQHHGAFSLTAGRTFVIAFGARVAPQGIACSARDVTLADVAPTIRALVGLPVDAAFEAGTPIAEIIGPELSKTASLGGYWGTGLAGSGALQRP